MIANGSVLCRAQAAKYVGRRVKRLALPSGRERRSQPLPWEAKRRSVDLAPQPNRIIAQLPCGKCCAQDTGGQYV